MLFAGQNSFKNMKNNHPKIWILPLELFVNTLLNNLEKKKHNSWVIIGDIL